MEERLEERRKWRRDKDRGENGGEERMEERREWRRG